MSLFAFFLAAMFIGVPVAFAFAIAGMLYLLWSEYPTLDLDNLITVTFGGLDSFVLMSIPFFIFAGDLMKQGGIITRLMDFSGLFLRQSRSATGGITILTSTFFGAISGSAAAAVAAVGSIMVPEMKKQGYEPARASALAAASGFIGVMIPPSIPLILYGLASGSSIGALFLAGIVPGLLVALAFLLLNRVLSRRNPQPAADAPSGSGHILRTALFAVPGLFLPVLILGGIYSGIFTPTEAAAVAVFYAMLVGRFVYRGFRLRDLPRIALGSAITSATIMIIIGFAAFFGRLMTLDQIPAAISGAILGITESPILLILLINVFLLVVGMFVETATMILITTPILLPLATQIGIDPVHFGIIMILNLSIGLITPPMALNIFVAARVSGLKPHRLVIPILPYVAVSLLVLMLVTYVPQISTFLPSVLQ